MNIDEQLKLIRGKKHEDYMKHINALEDKKQHDYQKKIETDNKNKKISVLANLRQKYQYVFNLNTKERAAKTIQKFFRNNYFEPLCVNEEEIRNIPPIYRLRIFITIEHINEYSEEGITEDLLEMHRFIYKIAHTPSNKYIILRYCFDIRKLYPIRNCIIELYDGFYFMQPNDHIKINALWKKVNNKTNESIIFLNTFEYQKSLSVDMYKNKKNTEKDIIKEIEEILDQAEHSNTNTIDTTNMENMNHIFLDNEYIDALNREYMQVK
jgi:hypothetical protein